MNTARVYHEIRRKRPAMRPSDAWFYAMVVTTPAMQSAQAVNEIKELDL